MSTPNRGQPSTQSLIHNPVVRTAAPEKKARALRRGSQVKRTFEARIRQVSIPTRSLVSDTRTRIDGSPTTDAKNAPSKNRTSELSTNDLRAGKLPFVTSDWVNASIAAAAALLSNP